MKLSESSKYIIKDLIPYTDPNLKLVYHPNHFFNELERKSRIKERTLRSAYYRLIKKGLVTIEGGHPKLTKKGELQAKIYNPTKLEGSTLMVIFDIPENERNLRDHLRLLLKELKFKKVQQSVWVCKYDFREYITAEIKENGLQKYVQVYESRKI